MKHNFLRSRPGSSADASKEEKAKESDDAGAILLGTVESQLVADCMEEGLGLRNTTYLVNTYREKKGFMHVGRSAVRSAYLQLMPVVTKLGLSLNWQQPGAHAARLLHLQRPRRRRQPAHCPDADGITPGRPGKHRNS